MFEATTLDFGKTWVFTPLTRNSPAMNLRPVCAVAEQHVAVLWMRGRYPTFFSCANGVPWAAFRSATCP
jgi:hypothetical protein